MSWIHIGDRLVEPHPPYLPYARPYYTYHGWVPPSKADAFSRPRSATTHHYMTPPYSSAYQQHRSTQTPVDTRAMASPRAQHKHHVHLVDHEYPTCELFGVKKFVWPIACISPWLYLVSFARSYHTHEVIHRHHYPHYVSTETYHTHTRDERPTAFPPLSHGELAGSFVVDPVRSYELDAIRACYDSPYEAKRSSFYGRSHRCCCSFDISSLPPLQARSDNPIHPTATRLVVAFHACTDRIIEHVLHILVRLTEPVLYQITLHWRTYTTVVHLCVVEDSHHPVLCLIRRLPSVSVSFMPLCHTPPPPKKKKKLSSSEGQDTVAT